MRKLIVVVVALLITASAFGQKKTTFGFTGGAGIDGEGFWGYQAGFIGEHTFKSKIYLNTAIVFEKYFDELSVKVPFHVGYKIPVSPKVNIVGDLGPHISFDILARDILFIGAGVKLGVDITKNFRIFVSEDFYVEFGFGLNVTSIGFNIFF